MPLQNINPSLISANNTVSGQVLTSNGTVTYWSSGTTFGTPIFLDDISGYFDGANTTFKLTYNNGTGISPSIPYNVTVYVGNIPVGPSWYRYDYFNLPEVSVFNSGFVITGNTISFATAPTPGMSFYGTVINSPSIQTFSYKQAPFKPLSIMLGP